MMVINLQFWEADKAQAMALARLIADLEPVKRDDVVFMFTARFDCLQDEETIAYVGEKFPIFKHTTKRAVTGWPNGPNQMMACSYERIVKEWKKGWNVDRVFFIEPDSVPLHREWINKLKAEYDNCGRNVLGAWLKRGDASCEHVNGNCVVSVRFFKKCPGMLHPPSRGGWDAALAYAILPNASPSRLIWSDYQLGMSHNPWKGDDFLWGPKKYGCKDNALFGQELFPVWFHGIKTMDGINAVRKRLLNESQDQKN